MVPLLLVSKAMTHSVVKEMFQISASPILAKQSEPPIISRKRWQARCECQSTLRFPKATYEALFPLCKSWPRNLDHKPARACMKFVPESVHTSEAGEEQAVDDRTIGHNPERLSLLKGGIVYSNAVTTVSPTYVNETLCSGWLASTLMQHREKYMGILNGIDTGLWDPTRDTYLPAPFGAMNLKGKHICKHYIQRGLGLDFTSLPAKEHFPSVNKQSPLVICITRLVAQKGIHLIRYALNNIDQLGGQFVLLGTAPDTRVQMEFENLANQYKANKKVRLLPTYSEELAHLLYAAADMVLVPSMFEPCGLTQMIGMRYGAIPVVRKTGGLADTVFDVDDPATMSKANGFVFQGIDEGSLNGALERALRYYFERPAWWLELVSKVMQLDNSWIKSAGEYIDLYNSIRVKW